MPTISSKMGGANSIMSLENPSPLRELQEVYSKFHLRCRSCKNRVSFDDLKSNIDAWICPQNDSPVENPPLLAAAECQRCSALTCMGCGRKPSKNNAHTIIDSDNLKVCCERGRLFCIWLVLCRFDDHELELQVKLSKANAKVPKAQKIAKDTGIGYDARYDWGSYEHGFPPKQSIKREVIETVESSDSQMTATLVLLRRLLSKSTVSLALPGTQNEIILFRTSLLLERVCALIRNDSISDLSQRSEMYYELFSFLEIIVHDPRLVELLFELQPSRKESPGLRALSEASNNRQHSFDIAGDQSSSIFTSFDLTHKQANVFLDVSKKIKRSRSKLGSGPDPTDMCKTIVKLYSILEEKAEKIASSPCNIHDIKDPWAEFSERNRVTFTDDVLKNHRYKKSFPSIKHSTRDRMLVIGREISTMTTSLPPGVFVKVAESRADVMKVLMVGVEGSPYAGGIFNFDLLLPQNYPNSPPKMAFVLEGVDTDTPAMNPNLHPGGLVCLSILNTWSGDENQMWQPRKSTILAVLVSVQAMILGAPLPWLNEPGLSDQAETPQANEHKLVIQLKTIKHAMITWLKKSKLSDANAEPDVWQDIVEVYWKYNHKKVLDTVEQWSVENPHIKSYDKAAVQPLGIWMGGTETPPRVKTEPSAETENLAQKLKDLILMEKAAITQVSSDGSATSTSTDHSNGKRKEPASNTEPKKDIDEEGSKRQKTEKPENPAAVHDSDSKNGANNPLSESSHEQFPQHLFDSEEELDFDPGALFYKWVYTGSRKFKDIKAACQEFGIKPDRTIVLSISKLENHVTNNVNLNDELALKYGKVEDD